MYTVYADGHLLYHPDLVNNGYGIYNSTINYEANKSGSFQFKMPVTNVMYNSLTKMSSIITVYKDSEEIFRGRVLNDSRDYYNNKSVYVEGELAFLLDSIVRPVEWNGTISEFFTHIIQSHNEQVDASKRFTVGECTVLANNEITYSITDYDNCWNVLNSYLLDVYGGYIRTRVENGVRYIDYISSYNSTSDQVVQFGENLLDLSQYVTGENVITRLIPLGATYETEKEDNEITQGTKIIDYESEPVENKKKDNARTFTFAMEVLVNSKSKANETTNVTINFKVKVNDNKTLSWSGASTSKIYAVIKTKTDKKTTQRQKTGLVSVNWTSNYTTVCTWTGDLKTAMTTISCEFVNNTSTKDNKPVSCGMSRYVDLLQQKTMRVDITSVTQGGVDYIVNQQAEDLFGQITGVQIWDDVETPSELLTKGEEYLNDNIALNVTLDVNAVDLNLLNVAYEKFKIGDRIRVVSAPHAVDNYFTCTAMSIDLQNPEQNQYTLGAEYKTLTETQIVNTNKLALTDDQINSIWEQMDEMTDIVQEANELIQTIYDQYADVTTVIENLDATYAEIDFANIDTAAINNLIANQAFITELNTKYAQIDFANIGSAAIQNLTTNSTFTNYLSTNYANINFANITEAAITRIFGATGIVNNLTITEGHVTGYLAGVRITGDVIEANTIKADSLIVQGEDGVYYKLNVDGLNNISTSEAAKFTKLTAKPADWDTNWKDYYRITNNEYVHLTENTAPTWTANTYYKLSSTYESGLDGSNIVANSVTANQIAAHTITANELNIVSAQDGLGITTLSATVDGINATVSSMETTVDNSIASVTSTYAYGDSTTTHPADSAFTYSSMPTRQDGKYIWRKNVITKNSGATTTTYEMVQGADGASGTSITISSVQYASASQGTDYSTVTGWQNTIPSVAEGNYLWTKTTYSDGTATYTSAYQGEDGTNGTSVTISSQNVRYQASNSGTTTPTGTWQTSPSAAGATKGQYLWTRTIVNYSNGTSTTSYSVSYMGTDGEDGTSVWVQSATKTGDTTTVILKDSEGNTTTLTIDDGTDGTNGTPGANGYVHIAWANSADGTTDFSTSVSTNKKYMGVYTDNTQADSQSPSAYSWSLIKGADGSSVSVTSVKYTSSTSGTTIPQSGWQDTVPSVAQGSYLWTQTNYSDGTSSYTASRQGANGGTGPAGTSVTGSSDSLSYANSTSGTQAPTSGWTSSPSPVSGQYLWTKTETTFTYSNNTTSTTTSYSVAYIAINGTSPTAYDLQANNYAVIKDQDGNYSVSTVTFSAYSQTGNGTKGAYSGRFKIYTTTDNSSWTLRYTSNSNQSSYTYTIPADIKGIKAELYLANGTTTMVDTLTVPIILDGIDGTNGQNGNDGKDAYTVVLTNESHTFPGDSTKAIAGSTTCNVIGYKGATQMACTIGTITGQVTGLTTSITSNGTTSAYFTVTVTTSLTTRNGVLTVPVTIDGKTFNMKFSWSLALSGTNGYNVATVWLFQRADSAPSKPTSALTYTFSTGVLSGTLGSWTQTVPADNGKKCYVITATASSTSSTDSIATTDWSAVNEFVESGTNGTDGYNSATVTLYKRSATAVTSKPYSSAVNYTFSTHSLASIPSGWSTSIPASDGNPCYASSASAVSRTDTASIAVADWNTPIKLVEDGEDGVSVDSMALLYYMKDKMLHPELKGNTLQNGTPTPDSPVAIHSVSGDNTVIVTGKNLCPPLTIGVGLNSTTGIEATSSTSAISDYIPVDFSANPNYIFSGLVNTMYSWAGAYNSSRQFLGRTGAGARETLTITSSSFTGGTPQGSGDAKYIRITQYETTNTTGTIDLINSAKIQLEVGTTATEYTPYQEQEYPITLPVENLLDISNYSYIYSNMSVADNSIIISSLGSGATSRVYFSQTFASGEYTISATCPEGITPRIWSDKQFSGGTYNSYYGGWFKEFTTYTSVTLADESKIGLIFAGTAGTQATITKIQLEKGSKANTYTPYGTTPITLNKIGTYQDYIYKSSDGEWYLHKEIAEVDLGTLSWNKYNGTSNIPVFYVSLSTIKIASGASTLCTSYVCSAWTALGSRVDNTIQVHPTLQIIYLADEDYSDATTLKTDLNGVMYYYPLATATDTLIENETLINQLDALESAYAYDNVTNVLQDNNDLPFDIEYNESAGVYPTAPTSEVTVKTDTPDIWTLLKPTYINGYAYYNTLQVKLDDGSVSWGDVQLDSEIDGIYQSLTDLNKRIIETNADIDILDDQINYIVSRTETIEGSYVSQTSLDGQLATVKSQYQTAIKQSADDINISISNIQTTVDGLSTNITTYFTFGSDGLIIGKSGNGNTDTMTAHFTNSETYFADNTNAKLAGISASEGLYGAKLALGNATTKTQRWFITTGGTDYERFDVDRYSS